MVKLVKRLLILLVGLCIAHLGVTLFLLTNLGSDPFNVLVQGIHNTITKVPFMGFLTHGYTHMAICFLIIVVLLFVDRSYVKIGTIVCMFCGGPIIDFFDWLLRGIINENNPFVLRLVILAAGCVILAFGMTIVIKSEAGTGPNDLVSIAISDKLHKKFGIVRIIVDVAFVIAGFLLGGVIGIGTVICAILVGPVAEIFLPFHEKWIKKIVK
ncbi:MAG: hypothetical protein IJA74_04780 [Oscillospiraceae bacterium]|nr:hypothetical protein [Oscillospiraceae bacterium]